MSSYIIKKAKTATTNSLQKALDKKIKSITIRNQSPISFKTLIFKAGDNLPSFKIDRISY